MDQQNVFLKKTCIVEVWMRNEKDWLCSWDIGEICIIVGEICLLVGETKSLLLSVSILEIRLERRELLGENNIKSNIVNVCVIIILICMYKCYFMF